MDISLRPIATSDEPAWRRLWTAYLDFYEAEVEEVVYETTFARLCDPQVKDQNGILALQGDRPVGLVHYIYHAHNWRVEPICYLQDLYADPEVRGHGVGRALIEAVYAQADRDGCPAVYWMTQDFNATARQLYDRIGQVTPFIKYVR